jgi:serine/threonine protein kinase
VSLEPGQITLRGLASPDYSAREGSLGSYRLVRKLGTGGMAEVFLAAQRMQGGVIRPVVVKAILPHLVEDERFVEDFLREARVAAMLSHPNIVHIHDVSVLDGRPCIVMEFLKGRDLWTVLARLGERGAAVGPQAAAAVVAQASAALDYAHRKRDRKGRPLDLVHRDISPHNLFLTRDGQVRVLDFGIAKSAFQQHRTESGVIKGKLAYMAPEQARGKDVDHRADLFALGVVLWEMLAGQRLFARDDAFQTVTAMFHDDVPEPSSVRPVPEGLEAIVMKALQRDPTDRFDSCESLTQALRRWLVEAGAPPEQRLVQGLLSKTIPEAEDGEFYAPDRPVDPQILSTETSLIGIDTSPDPLGETSEVVSPAGAVSTKKGSVLPPWWRWAALAVGLVTIPFVVTAIALRKDDPPEQPPPIAQPDVEPEAPPEVEPEPPEPVTIRFAGVPEGVTIEVDGEALDGDVFRVLPSDDTHHVRAVHEGQELWRYDALFRAEAEVELPPLTLPTDAEPEPEVSEAAPEVEVSDPPPRRRRRIRRRRAAMRGLGMQIDLDYP